MNYLKIIFLLILLGSFFSFSQNEDPVKLLAFTKKEQLDTYLKSYNWKTEKQTFKDSIDGEYYLYSKKTSGGGNAYLAIYPNYPNKFMHYMVFFEAKKNYSKVLSYEEFLHMPEGKSRFNSSAENKVYAIKSISFDDPNETRNHNIFFGRIPAKEGMELKPIHNIEEFTKKDLKELKKKEQDEEINEMIKEIEMEEQLNEDTLPSDTISPK